MKQLRKVLSLLIPIITLVIIGITLRHTPAVTPQASAASNLQNIKTVFIILMENHNWSEVKTAPYISSLVSQGAHAEQYFTPPGLHPSEPNYIWLEAGSNFGITNDSDPTTNHLSTTNHLVTLLNNAGKSWKAYEEDIPGTNCPLSSVGGYAPKHLGAIFFDDVTGTNNPSYQYCINHVRPYTELATDLTNSTVANYNFITPNLCDDMHDCSVTTGDNWLKAQVPNILNSAAYKNGGALFITWDEGSSSSDGPIGMIVLSPYAKVNYQNSIHYTHSSTLRTMQEIFGVDSSFLNDAANATDLSDLFSFTGVTTTPAPTTAPSPTPTVAATPTPTTVVSTTAPTPTVTCPTMPTDKGTATTSITTDTAGTYTIWSRIMAPDTTNNSYYLQVDNQCGIDVGDDATMPANTWTWVNYANGTASTKVAVNLSAGSHVIKMIGRETGVKLDKLIITADASCIPTGTGDNCTTATPTPGGATGTVTFRNSASANNGAGSTTIALPVPSGTAASDVMVAQITVNGATTGITPPAGWTVVQDNASSSTIHMVSYVKVATSAEPASYTFTLSASQPAAGGISSYTGVNTASPIDASSNMYNTSVSTASVNQVTTTVPNDMLVFLVGVGANSTVTPATGFVERFDVNNGTATNGRTSELSDEVQATVGTTSVGSATSAASGISNLTQLIALKAASVQPTNTPVPPTATTVPATPTSTSATATPTGTACVSPVPAPTNLAPSGTIPAGTTKLTWGAVAGTTYAIRIDDTQDAWNGSCSAPNGSDICQNGLTTNSFTFTAVAGHTYNWWLNAVNACGTFSPNSSTATLTVSSTVTPTSTPIPTATPLPTNTPTPLPTSTPAPTATPVPNSAKAAVTVFLHGIGLGGDNTNPTGAGNMNPLHPQKSVQLFIYDATNTLIGSPIGTVNYNSTAGNFSGVIDLGSSIPSGSYLVKIKSPNYLRAAVGGIFTFTTGQTTTIPTVSLIAGDANGDNQLNILDYNLILDCYSDIGPARACDPTKFSQTDLNDDGAVNQFDYNLFLRELSVQTGQ